MSNRNEKTKMKNAIFQYFLSYNGVGKCKHYRDSDDIPIWGKRSVDYFKHYAKLHAADHFFFTESKLKPTSNYFEKCRVYLDPMFDQYDKVLYVDIDVLPKNMNANVFDINVNDVAGWPEWRHPNITGTPKWRATPALTQRFADFGSKLIKPKTINAPVRMINTGVVLWSRKARLKARKKFDDYETWFKHKNRLLVDRDEPSWGHSSHCLDQPYFNAMWNKYDFDVLELDYIWNRFPTKDENTPCNFAHYVGSDSRYNIPDLFPGIKTNED